MAVLPPRWSLGAFSRMMTSAPSCTAVMAAERPAMPPPTTATSHSTSEMVSSIAIRVRTRQRLHPEAPVGGRDIRQPAAAALAAGVNMARPTADSQAESGSCVWLLGSATLSGYPPALGVIVH